MRITKRQLRRIIKEETVRQQSREGLVGAEGQLLGELMTITRDLMNIEKELYGLVDGDRVDMGSVYGEELNATIEEIENFREKLNTHFELYDDLAGRNPGGSIG